MTPSPSSTETFEQLRPRLFRLSYRMLGSRAEAEDIVQETYVRWHGADRAAIDNAEAWLVTAATRLAIDRLRRLKTEREAYAGPWLPEPLVGPAPPSPDRGLEMADELSMAMLTLLETLAPDERAAFLLHDVFDVDYRRIADILAKSEAACRQTVSRARERVRGPRKRFEVSDASKTALLDTFRLAVEASDEEALTSLFASDAVWTADGGGKVAAGPRPLVGVDQIVRLLLGLRRNYWAHDRVFDIVRVNGEPGLTIRDGNRITAVMAFDVDDDRIVSVYAVVNPDKLPRTAPT